MLDENTVFYVMRDRLLSIAGLDASDGGNVALQNRGFERPAPELGIFYVEEYQEVIDETLGLTETVEIVGITTYSVYTAAGGSVEAGNATSLAIAEAFRMGQTLRDVNGVDQGCPIELWKTQRQSPFYDTDAQAWYIQPVQVNWRAFATNPAVF